MSEDSWLDIDTLSKPKAQGFGFGMAIVWCIVYFVIMQVVATIACGLPVFAIAMMINGDIPAANQPPDAKAPEADMLNEPSYQKATLVVLIISHLFGLGTAWFMLRYLCGKQWKRKIALSRRPTGTHMALILLGFPAMIALSVGLDATITKYVPSLQDVLNALVTDPNKRIHWPGIEQLGELFKSTPFGLGLFAVAIMPAINEEFWCRGFLNHGMASRYRTWAVVLLTSFLFGCLHLDPRQGLGAMFLGAAIHAAYLATRSLGVAMFIHFANNGLAVLHMNEGMNCPILKPFELLYENPGTRPLFIGSAAVLFAAIAYALYQTRCQVVPNGTDARAWQPVGPASAEVPPADTNMTIEHEPLNVLSVCVIVGGALCFGAVLAWA